MLEKTVPPHVKAAEAKAEAAEAKAQALMWEAEIAAADAATQHRPGAIPPRYYDLTRRAQVPPWKKYQLFQVQRVVGSVPLKVSGIRKRGGVLRHV